MATMAWVNFFFTGFVVAKVPFPLTQKFRGMLQRGVDLQSLDVTYVSSLSWYFLNVFGLRGLLSVALGEETVDDTAIMQQQMQMGMDTNQAYKARTGVRGQGSAEAAARRRGGPCAWAVAVARGASHAPLHVTVPQIASPFYPALTPPLPSISGGERSS